MDTISRTDSRATRPESVVRRLVGDTPRRLMLTGAGLAAMLGVLAAALVAGTSQARDGISAISQRTDEASATNDLYFRLCDMDAQAANALLVGFHPVSSVPASVDADASVATYQSDRKAADSDLQRIALDPALAAQYTGLLDALGDYESLVGQALFIDQGVGSQKPALPPAAALSAYQSASALMHGSVLHIASQIVDTDGKQVDGQYAADHSGARTYAVLTAALGLVTLLALVAANRYLARRFRRMIAPGLAAAAAITVAVTAAAAATLLHVADDLHTAKQDAFDSINALTRTRAVSYDANADESRWLLQRTPDLQQSFFTKVSQVAAVAGTDGPSAARNPTTFYSGLKSAASALALNDADNSVSSVRLGGFLGTELNNITFPGEAQAAYRTLEDFGTYVQGDAVIRTDAGRGDLTAAVAFDIGVQPGQSNFAYYQYDRALQKVIAINQQAFHAAIADGRSSLSLWTWLSYAAAIAACGFVGAAVYPRLREFR